jgi:hypothetical protein
LGESTDIAGEAQVLAFVRVSDVIMEHIFLTFCTLTDLMEQSTLKRETQQHIIAHSERMSVDFEYHFTFLTAVSDGSTDWICSPLSMDAVSKENLSRNNQEHLVEIMSDHRFQRSFKETLLSQFWM